MWFNLIDKEAMRDDNRLRISLLSLITSLVSGRRGMISFCLDGVGSPWKIPFKSGGKHANLIITKRRQLMIDIMLNQQKSKMGRKNENK